MYNPTVSGADDSAPVIYYSNTHFNNTTQPKLSNVEEHLQMPLINNQSNYLVSINKLKISDLSGVVLSYFPSDLQLGMILSDGITSIYKDDFLVKANNTDSYVSNYDLFQTTNNNDNIVIVNNITASAVVGVYSLPRVPVFCNFISLNNSLIYNDYQNIYTYNLTTLQETTYATITAASITCSDNYNSNIVVCLDNGVINRYDLSTANTPILITVTPLSNTPYRISTVSINIDTIVVTWINNNDLIVQGQDSILYVTKLSYQGAIIDSPQIIAKNTQARKSIYSDNDKLLIISLDGNPRAGSWYIPPIIQSNNTGTFEESFTVYNLLNGLTGAPGNITQTWISSYVYVPSKQLAICIDTYGVRLGFMTIDPRNLYTINFDNMTWYPSEYLLPSYQGPTGNAISPRYLANGIINNQSYNMVAIQVSTSQIAIWISVITSDILADQWILYTTLNISEAQQPVNIIPVNVQVSDLYFYLTIDANNNIFLTFNQLTAGNLNDTTYYTVKLNTMTMTNGIIDLITQPYTPITIPLMFNNVNLSIGSEIPASYNLMYDANTQIFMARNGNNLLYGYFDNILNTLFFKIGANMANIDGNIFSQTLRYKQCINGLVFPNATYPSQTPYTTGFITYPSIQPTNLTSYNTPYLFNSINISHNSIENVYTLNNNPNTTQTSYKYQGAGIFSTLNQINVQPYLKISSQYNTVTQNNTTSNTAIYSLEEYINSINNCFVKLYNDITINEFTPLITSAPFVSLDILTGYITMNYDSQFNNINNGIFVNDKLLSYMLFQTSNNNVQVPLQLKNKYILNSSGKSIQSRLSFFKFNQIDKIIIVSNMSIISDTSGSAAAQNNTFTDLDLNLNDPNMLNLSGSFLYAAVLLRNYTLMSNQQLRNINYQINIRYIDKSELPYYIPSGENVSIKFQFTRIY